MTDTITRGKEVVARIREGWSLWCVANDALPGRWELRRGRELVRVHWDAIIGPGGVRPHYLAEVERLTDAVQEGRFTWGYIPKQGEMLWQKWLEERRARRSPA